jgi:hypothetical protein
MQAFLQAQGTWRIVKGESSEPPMSSPPTSTEHNTNEAWHVQFEKAAGQLYLMVEQNQKIHFQGITDNPLKMWKALQAVHMQKRPGNRFNAYDNLFSIRKHEDETLQTLTLGAVAYVGSDFICMKLRGNLKWIHI